MFFKKVLCLIAVSSLFLFPGAGFSEKAGMSLTKPDAVYQKAVPGEAQVLKRLNARAGWEFAKRLSRISGNTDGSGFRYAGTPAGSEASNLVFTAFSRLGLNPVYDEFPVMGWNYRKSSLNLNDPDKIKIRVNPLHGTPPTPPDGIKAEIIYVGSATRQDLEGKNLSGRIALVEADLEVIPWYTEAADQCQRRGALAVVFFIKSFFGSTPNGETFWTIDLSGARINIPVLNTPVNDGRKLKEMLLASKSKPIQCSLVSQIEIIPDARGKNVIGSITGNKYPGEYIIISAHTDAYFSGFQDDALPVGLLVAMARAMKESRYKPDRTILFIAFDSEECGRTGTHYSWLAGSWHYAKKHSPLWKGRVVGNVNLELLAAKDKDYFAIRSSDTLYTFIDAISRKLKLSAHSRNDGVINSINPWNDEWSLSIFGVPTLTPNFQYQLVSRPDEVNIIDYYHSQLDDEHHASFAKYADCARVFTTITLRMDRQPLNPYDLSLTPAHYLSSLNQKTLNGQGYDDSLKNAAESFALKAKKLRDMQTEIDKLFSSAPQRARNALQILFPEYNQALRNAAYTVITGTQYLDWDIPSFQVPYYQEMPVKLDRAIDSLKKGDGKAMLEGFSFCGMSAHYARFLDYSVWKDAYRESLEVGKSSGDLHWGTGRVLKYYDFYRTLERIRTKVSAGTTDFTPEINELAKIKDDVNGRLKKAVAEDTAVWQKAEKELPLKIADRMLGLLKKKVR
jgi:Iap family predicted aminopeptidase